MAENGDRHALECHLALSRNRPEVGGWPGPMAITMLRRVGLRPRLHRRGPEAARGEDSRTGVRRCIAWRPGRGAAWRASRLSSLFAAPTVDAQKRRRV